MPPLRALILVLCLVACAMPQVPPDAGPAAPLARAALAEWDRWGRVAVIGWPETRPADTAATPSRFARLLGYWEALGADGVARGLLRERQAITASFAEQGSGEEAPSGAEQPAGPEDIGLYNTPAWSAAFVSAVARRAGLPESDLPSSATHARYIDAVLARAAIDPDRAGFLPFAPEERAPRPGDLLCADRAALPLAHWSDRLAETGHFRPMHCDVVVRTSPGAIDLIGGNVEDMVLLRRVPADAAGHVLPAPPGRPVFLLLLAARG